MKTTDVRVRRAITAMAGGHAVVLTGDPNGDGYLVFAAQAATPRLVAFAVRHTSGYLRVALPGAECERLHLPPMCDRDTTHCVSVDVRGTGTGISASDRAWTIAALASATSVAADFQRPGHVVPIAGPRTPVAGVGHRAKRRSCAAQAENLPWDTRSLTMASAGQGGPSRTLPDVLPSRIVARADEPFDQFDPDDLRLLGAWLEATMARWPRRRSMRFESSPHGKRIDLRATMNASRSTGWESVLLARIRPRRRPRRVLLLCDVSRSMQPYAAIYLRLMRAAVLRRAGGHPEVFAFSTSLTRLTSVLSHRSAEMALHRANARVTDRYGGTFIGRSVAALLAPPHGNALRGAVVIIASDGWDSDPPDVLVHALTRVRRRAELLVWLNPRAAHPEFQPRAGSMAAALPYCDLFLPAHSLAGLHQLLLALAGAR